MGALGVSLILVPWIGTQNSERVLLTLSAASALFVLWPYVAEHRSKIPAAVLTAALVLAGLLAKT